MLTFLPGSYALYVINTDEVHMHIGVMTAPDVVDGPCITSWEKGWIRWALTLELLVSATSD